MERKARSLSQQEQVEILDNLITCLEKEVSSEETMFSSFMTPLSLAIVGGLFSIVFTIVSYANNSAVWLPGLIVSLILSALGVCLIWKLVELSKSLQNWRRSLKPLYRVRQDLLYFGKIPDKEFEQDMISWSRLFE